MVADGDVGDSGADLLDDAGTLMTEHDGRADGDVAEARMLVGAAQAGGNNANEDLVLARIGDLKLLERERSAMLLDNCCFDLHITCSFRLH